MVAGVAHEGAKKALAGSLRRGMTVAERRLWSKLRDSRFHGLRWCRQEPVGPFVVDFYCSAARLALEVDGASHAYSLSRDGSRDAWLETQGITVLRVPNWAVMNELSAVLDEIYGFCRGHLPEGD